MGHKLKNQLPRAHLYVLEDAMHCIHLEHPAATAALIDRFAQTDPGNWPDVRYGSAAIARVEIAAEEPPYEETANDHYAHY
jgi:hypothetical protein